MEHETKIIRHNSKWKGLETCHKMTQCFLVLFNQRFVLCSTILYIILTVIYSFENGNCVFGVQLAFACFPNNDEIV